MTRQRPHGARQHRHGEFTAQRIGTTGSRHAEFPGVVPAGEIADCCAGLTDLQLSTEYVDNSRDKPWLLHRTVMNPRVWGALAKESPCNEGAAMAPDMLVGKAWPNFDAVMGTQLAGLVQVSPARRRACADLERS